MVYMRVAFWYCIRTFGLASSMKPDVVASATRMGRGILNKCQLRGLPKCGLHQGKDGFSTCSTSDLATFFAPKTWQLASMLVFANKVYIGKRLYVCIYYVYFLVESQDARVCVKRNAVMEEAVFQIN